MLKTDSVNEIHSRETLQKATLDCACFSLRKVTRAVTNLYDEELRAVGLRSGQFILLLTVRMLERAPIHQLATETWLDRSALSRNLRPLQRDGYIAIEPGDDRRTRHVTLTQKGEGKIKEAYPLWQKAQAATRDLVGESQLAEFFDELKKLEDRLNPSESGSN